MNLPIIMESKEYSITINASKEKVWDIMIGEGTYDKWVKAFSPNSEKEGEWIQGSYMNFIDKNIGGTRALLEVVDKPNRIVAKHITLLSKEGAQDVKSEVFQKWNGSIEEYLLSEENGVTKVRILMKCHKDFFEMFDSCWPIALKNLKYLCENGS